MTDKPNTPSTPPSAPMSRIEPTGQKRSLERGKSTRKKNPGKRSDQGG